MKRRWEYSIFIHTLVVHFKLSKAFIVQFIVDRACISKRNNRRYGTILFYELKNDQRLTLFAISEYLIILLTLWEKRRRLIKCSY